MNLSLQTGHLWFCYLEQREQNWSWEKLRHTVQNVEYTASIFTSKLPNILGFPGVCDGKWTKYTMENFSILLYIPNILRICNLILRGLSVIWFVIWFHEVIKFLWSLTYPWLCRIKWFFTLVYVLLQGHFFCNVIWF